ncbi:MAG: nitrogen regulation protein NR(I), partial [Burkholderiaceae bacterium]|nr:nitrogen regulation protein NR(I) [Burkholderiaceae bacterium]
SARQLGVEPKRIADAALARLALFAFPGNVRQLENICHWLTVMAPAQVISVQDLPPEVLEVPAAPAAAVTPAQLPIPPLGQPPIHVPPMAEPRAGAIYADWESTLEAEAQALLASGQADVWDVLTRRFESRLITAALAATHGRRMEAAQRLGIGRNTITRKIQELGLDAHED